MYPDASAGAASPIGILNGFMGSLSGALLSICFITGIAFITAGLYQWNEHRKNPGMLPFSQVVTLWILGIALLLLQYLPMTQVG